MLRHLVYKATLVFTDRNQNSQNLGDGSVARQTDRIKKVLQPAKSMGFFRQYIAPLFIVLLFAVALLAVSVRIFLPSDMMAPAPIEEPISAIHAHELAVVPMPAFFL